MTDVVTNTAAYVQPLLYANRQQALGVPNPESPATDVALASAASQQQQILDSTQVAQASDDRSSLKQGGDGANQSANQNFANQPPTASPAATASDITPPTTGPAKARVDIPVFDINSLTSTPAPSASPQVATPSPLPSAQQAPDVSPQPQPQVSGVLGPAAQITDADLAIVSANIFGAAFAPTQLGQVSGSATSTPSQKNFISARRKVFGDPEMSSQSSSWFATSPVAAAASTAGSQFAVSAAAAQKLSVKVSAAATSILAAGGQTPASGAVSLTGDSTDADPPFSSVDARQSLYQRAQAVAQALGEKSSNPAVKNLIATLESYALVTGIGPGVNSAVHPAVRVIA